MSLFSAFSISLYHQVELSKLSKTMIDEILAYNKQFVEKKGYEEYITNKYPDKKIAILSCMDTRLTALLPAALGIKNGDVKMIKNAGGVITHPFGSAMRSLMVAIYELGVEEIMIIGHTDCGAQHLNYEDMLGVVDAVIIARDDVGSHYEIARFFLDNEKYVMVDKPLTIDEDQLRYYIPFLERGKLLSASGLRYKSEMRTSFYGKLEKDDVLFANAFSVLDWCKYAIHVLEGVTPIMGADIVDVKSLHSGDNLCAKIEYKNDKYLMIQINKKVPIGIISRLYLKNFSTCNVYFDDNF